MNSLLMLAALGVGVLLSDPAMAANFSDPVHGVFKGAYGDTVAVEIPSTVSKSPDGAPGDLNFQVNSSTAYHGFKQLTDLKKGDAVAVDYTTSDRTQRLIATAISLENANIQGGTTQTTTTTTTVHTY